MPIGASALLVRDVALLDAVHHHSDYLNRAEDEADGMLNLVGRSLDTSRRFDALKILVGLRSTGRRRLAAMVEELVDLAAPRRRARRRARRARAARAAVDGHGRLSLVRRRRPARPHRRRRLDAANVAAQRALLRSGRAVVGRTRLDGRVALKLTLVNPLAGEDDVARAARARRRGRAGGVAGAA